MMDKANARDNLGTSSASVELVLSRLLQVLQEENVSLERHAVRSHANFAERKNQALRDLVGLQKTSPMSTNRLEHEKTLRRLKLALARNASLLGHHIKAVNEISDIIVGSMREAESDGTYSHGLGSYRD